MCRISFLGFCYLSLNDVADCQNRILNYPAAPRTPLYATELHRLVLYQVFGLFRKSPVPHTAIVSDLSFMLIDLPKTNWAPPCGRDTNGTIPIPWATHFNQG